MDLCLTHRVDDADVTTSTENSRHLNSIQVLLASIEPLLTYVV